MVWGHTASPCCPEIQTKPGARNYKTLGLVISTNGRSKQTGQEGTGEGHLIQQHTPGLHSPVCHTRDNPCEL